MTQSTDAPRSLVIERVLPHPPEKVWRALTQQPLLEQWVMKNDFQAIVGHKFTFRTDPTPHWNGIVEGEVLAVTPNEKLVYTWVSGLQFVVTWTLALTAGGTLLRMEQTGFDAEDTHSYEGAKFGWSRMLDTLSGLLAQA